MQWEMNGDNMDEKDEMFLFYKKQSLEWESGTWALDESDSHVYWWQAESGFYLESIWMFLGGY